jgi:hypothetical protein
MPITFTSKDINLTSFPHTDTMVTIVHIDRWDVTKIPIDNGSQAEILFLSTFDKMGFDGNQLREPSKPLYGFGGKRIKLVGIITLPVSFGTPKNPRSKYITFNVVVMAYLDNAIFGRGLLSTFEDALHSAYLSQNTDDFWSHSHLRQPARSQKYQEGFRARPQKCAFFVRAARAALNSTSSRMQKVHRGQRRAPKGTIGPKSPEPNYMHRYQSQSARPSVASELPRQKKQHVCVVDL